MKSPKPSFTPPVAKEKRKQNNYVSIVTGGTQYHSKHAIGPVFSFLTRVGFEGNLKGLPMIPCDLKSL